MKKFDPLQYAIDEGMILIVAWPDKDEFGSVHGKIYPWNDTLLKIKGNQISIEGVWYDADEDFYDFFGKMYPDEKAAMEAAGVWLLELNDLEKSFNAELKKMGAS